MIEALVIGFFILIGSLALIALCGRYGDNAEYTAYKHS